MFMDTANRTLDTSELEATGKFGISIPDQAHLMRMLRDTMYTDRILAVVREYGSNAWDAHQEAGIPDKPIQVKLPTHFCPFFTVRDFGPGLSEEDVLTLYTQYGRSTKRSDNTSVGGFGIGNKSGFAYTTSFTVTSWFQGVKAIYSAVLDAEDIGVMCKLGEEPCPLEETGMEISVPVKTQDFDAFRSRASMVYRFYTPQPTITGVELPKVGVLCEGIRLVSMGDNRYGQYASKVQMGCNTYDIPSEIIEYSTAPAVFVFPTGAMPVAANREGLKMTPETEKQLKALLKSRIEQAVTQSVGAFALEATLSWKKAQLYASRSLLEALFRLTRDPALRTAMNMNADWPSENLRNHGLARCDSFGGNRISGPNLGEDRVTRIVLVGRDANYVPVDGDYSVTYTKKITEARQRLDALLTILCIPDIPVIEVGVFTPPPKAPPKPRNKTPKPRAPSYVEYTWQASKEDYTGTQISVIPTTYIRAATPDKARVYTRAVGYHLTALLHPYSVETPVIVAPRTMRVSRKLKDVLMSGGEAFEEWLARFKIPEDTDIGLWNAIAQGSALEVLQKSVPFPWVDMPKRATVRGAGDPNHPLTKWLEATYGTADILSCPVRPTVRMDIYMRDTEVPEAIQVLVKERLKRHLSWANSALDLIYPAMGLKEERWRVGSTWDNLIFQYNKSLYRGHSPPETVVKGYLDALDELKRLKAAVSATANRVDTCNCSQPTDEKDF